MALLVPAFAILGWVGLFIHNLADLPGQTIMSTESLIPLLITGALVVLWSTPLRWGATWALLAWGLLNLVGAIVTVLPLSILPFYPDQSFTHYAFHVVYGLTQLPLIITSAIWLRRRGTRKGARESTR
ncbi:MULTISPECIES: hypothetical protein [Microbacterium]|uniref:hypothetical protein n=1 Tax=Microbacterium TaxID=33882 RepID=UPI00051A5D38|nr:hypothetical protein [Microbacterium profundi]